jgi:hypothetical protein
MDGLQAGKLSNAKASPGAAEFTNGVRPFSWRSSQFNNASLSMAMCQDLARIVAMVQSHRVRWPGLSKMTRAGRRSVSTSLQQILGTANDESVSDVRRVL